jgi:hypothetical protein
MPLPEARNDWNTPFPRDLSGIVRQADTMARQGTDVHTVTITLDNGGWEVRMDATNEDLEDVAMVGPLSNFSPE